MTLKTKNILAMYEKSQAGRYVLKLLFKPTLQKPWQNADLFQVRHGEARSIFEVGTEMVTFGIQEKQRIPRILA